MWNSPFVDLCIQSCHQATTGTIIARMKALRSDVRQPIALVTVNAWHQGPKMLFSDAGKWKSPMNAGYGTPLWLGRWKMMPNDPRVFCSPHSSVCPARWVLCLKTSCSLWTMLKLCRAAVLIGGLAWSLRLLVAEMGLFEHMLTITSNSHSWSSVFFESNTNLAGILRQTPKGQVLTNASQFFDALHLVKREEKTIKVHMLSWSFLMFLVYFLYIFPVKPMVSTWFPRVPLLGASCAPGSGWDSWDYSWKGKGRVRRARQAVPSRLVASWCECGIKGRNHINNSSVTYIYICVQV